MDPLIEELLPAPDIRMRHRRLVAAPAAAVFAALRTLRAPKGPLTLDRVTQAGFKLLGERPGQEIVLGVVGKFWRPSGERRPADREQFRLGAPAGEVLVAWNFEVTPGEAGKGKGPSSPPRPGSRLATRPPSEPSAAIGGSSTPGAR